MPIAAKRASRFHMTKGRRHEAEMRIDLLSDRSFLFLSIWPPGKDRSSDIESILWSGAG